MKAKTMAAVTALLMSSSLALAAGETQDHQAHHPEPADGTAQQMPAGPVGGMPMMQRHEQMHRRCMHRWRRFAVPRIRTSAMNSSSLRGRTCRA